MEVRAQRRQEAPRKVKIQITILHELWSERLEILNHLRHSLLHWGRSVPPVRVDVMTNSSWA